MRLWKAALVAGVFLPATALAQIRNSDHDLSFSSTTTVKNQNATENQICKYCHTPHRAQSTQLVWNHTASTTTSWTWGNDLDGAALTKTTAGTTLPTGLKSGSKRCLGCHDGTVAIGDVSNAGDGAAGVIPGLASIGTFTNAAGRLIDATHMVGVGGSMGGNHPVSIPYAGQTAYNGLNSGSGAIADGNPGNYYAVATASCGSPTGVCTAGPTTDGRDGTKINLIPNTPGGTTNVGIECTSCHEPHNKYSPNEYFTRVDVGNASGLCRSCHNK